MLDKRKVRVLVLASALIAAAACGGSSGNTVNLGGQGNSTSGSNVPDTTDPETAASGGVWQVAAAISGDTCGERISPVNQRFTINQLDSDIEVGTGIATVRGTQTASGFSFGFDESNGDCSRQYSGTFLNVTDSTADVQLVAKSTCQGRSCSSSWSGTATKVQ